MLCFFFNSMNKLKRYALRYQNKNKYLLMNLKKTLHKRIAVVYVCIIFHLKKTHKEILSQTIKKKINIYQIYNIILPLFLFSLSPPNSNKTI